MIPEPLKQGADFPLVVLVIFNFFFQAFNGLNPTRLCQFKLQFTRGPLKARGNI